MATVVLNTLQSQQQNFLQPSQELSSSALLLTKRYLDTLALDVSRAQSQRQRLQRQTRKRKRQDIQDERQEVLRAQQIYIDGFGAEQIWQQARRVLDAAITEVQRHAPGQVASRDNDGLSQQKKRVRFEEDDEGDLEVGSLGREGMDWEYDDEDVEGLDKLNDDEERAHEDGLALSEEKGNFSGAESETPSSEASDTEHSGEDLVKDKHGLNDGFFSIDRFNKSTQFLENVDARGDDDDGAASDEEDIDWGADPLTEGAQVSFSNPRKQAFSRDGDEMEDDDEGADESGPTFDDVELDATDTDEDWDDAAVTENNVMGDFSNTNDIMYEDFFAPPAGTKSRKRAMQGPSKRKGRSDVEPRKPFSTLATEEVNASFDEEESEMKRAMTSVRRDLSHGDVSDDNLESEQRSASGRDPSEKDLSTHERRMAAFRKEISRLEKENIANKSWALSGETVAPARPENALLEEDLDFERAGKPLPVITQELNESIEDLIKRRILNNDFDELIRRRPELENGKVRQGLVDTHGRREELSDVKPQKGLAEEYEDDYLRRTDPSYVDPRSEALKKKHAEIEKQWSGLRSQLDALSNWHYKPRPPETSLEVRTDTPVIRMEEARPTADTVGLVSGLAPQEVYTPGQSSRPSGEVMTKGGTAISKEEDSRESRRRRRRRMKERARKARGDVEVKGDGAKNQEAGGPGKAGKHEERDQVIKTLQRGDVKVIGKKGELQSVQGRAASTNAHGGKTGAAAFML